MNLNYEIYGHGEHAIVVETALGSTFVEWRPVLKPLSDKYLIFLYDRAGYGLSDVTNNRRIRRVKKVQSPPGRSR
jgi:hypothetical protein